MHPRESGKLETLHVQVSESEYMVEELAVLGGPSDLHHPRRDGRHLVVPDARIHAERAAHALKRRGVAAGLREGTNRGECVCVGVCLLCVQRFPPCGKLPSNLQAGGGDLQVLADIVAVEHGVDVGEVDFLVGELTALLQDWTEGTATHSF